MTTTEPNPFDSRPDPVLGHLLRDHLTAPDPDAFVARIRGALRARDTTWDILARWVWPGLAAAAAGLVIGTAVFNRPAEPVTLAVATSDDILQAAGAPSNAVTGAERPTPDAVLATALGIR